MKKLENKIAIVTGGADGLGKAGAVLFAEHGAQVIIWDLNEEKGNETVELIIGEGGKAAFMKVNTANFEEVESAVKEIISTYQRIDILINNAGITRDATLMKMTHEQWDQVIDVNLTGVFNCTKCVAPHMVANQYGRIVNTSSVVALYGNFGQTNYVATKAGLIGMTKTWARELGRKGINVNAVAPGFIATEMVMKMPENVLDGMKSRVPLQRLGKPEEIANVYLFLASADSSYVNGAIISADGGMTI
ncbi:MAG: 3-oxoacyl-[acyl-carrier-protein] reductase [Bacteroidales bacterium]|jgi:3-oxoacyl-[acyl-carrier protein] reductase|nr:3-oxoacyl-[acyl-carrier-protein] reductase [Bacteroidales bacterium]